MAENDWLGLIEITRDGSPKDKVDLVARLVGPEQGWLAACRQAVQTGNSAWLLPYARDEAMRMWPLALFTRRRAEDARIGVRLVECARSALLLSELRTTADPTRRSTALQGLAQAAYNWTNAAEDALSPSDGFEDAMLEKLGAELSLTHTDADVLANLLRVLYPKRASWTVAPLRDLLQDLLGIDDQTVWTRRVKVIAPLDLHAHGLLITLRLEIRPQGLGQFYPDPRIHAFLHGDERFAQSLSDAWAYAKCWHDGAADVRWRIEHPSSFFDEVTDYSLGAGFALGLRMLLDPSCPSLDLRGFAITGGITREGTLTTVEGYPRKLPVMQEARLKVIVPKEDLPEVQGLWMGHVHDLAAVSTLDEVLDVTSGLLNELLAYLAALIARLDRPPGYYPPGFTAAQVRQRVRVSRERLRYNEREPDGGEQGRRASYFAPEEGDRNLERERASAHWGREGQEGERRTGSGPRVQYWEELRGKVERAVILGDPGSGKTWLLRYEGLRVAREQGEGLRQGRQAVGRTTLPIFLRLDTLAEELAVGEDLLEAVVRALERELATRFSERFRDWVQAQIGGRECVFLLDGLDEVREDRRERLRAGLGMLAQATHGRIFLTSRIVGYGEAPFQFMGGGAGELEIVAFDREQVESFIAAWFVDQPERGAHLTSIVRREPTLRAQARIPLLLSFLCLIATASQSSPAGPVEIPTRRGELYELVLRLLLEGRWRAEELRETDPDRIETKLDLLEEIAWHFATARERWRDLMPGNELGRVIRSSPLAAYLMRSHPSRSLLRELSERDGVFVKVGAVETAQTLVPYLFLHRTFHEYLVARYLAHLPTDAWLLHVRPHLCFDADWEEVLVLLGGYLEDPNPLLDVLLDEPHDVFRRLLLLAGRCAGEARSQVLARNHVDWIVQGLISLLRSASSGDRVRSAAVLPLLGQSALGGLIVALRDPQADVRGAAGEALDAIHDPRAVPDLLMSLQDPTEQVRQHVVVALGNIGDPNTVDALLSSLRDPSGVVRLVAARALAAIGPASVGGLISALSDTQEHVRRLASRALGRIGRPAVQALLVSLRDRRPEVRSAALQALGSISGAPTTREFQQALEDPDERVRCGAARAIGQHRAGNLDSLQVAIYDAQPRVRAAVVQALGAIGDSRSVPILQETVRDPDLRVRWHAVRALGSIGDRRAIDDLLMCLGDPHEQIREAAVLALGATRDSRASPYLVDSLGDPAQMVREAATRAMGRIGTSSIPGLLAALRTRDRRLRRLTVQSLVRIGPSALPDLFTLLDGSKLDRDLRWEVVKGLTMGGESVVEGLRERLFATDWDVRWLCARALATIGDSGAVPELRLALKDTDWRVRAAAANALGKLGDAVAGYDLRQALHDPDRRVRAASASALGELGSMATQDLIIALDEAESEVRTAIVKALGLTRDQRAMSALQKALGDTDEQVRWYATRALAGMGPAAISILKHAVHDEKPRIREAVALAFGGLRNPQVLGLLREVIADRDERVTEVAIRAIAEIGLNAPIQASNHLLEIWCQEALSDELRVQIYEDLASLAPRMRQAAHETWQNWRSQCMSLTHYVQSVGLERPLPRAPFARAIEDSFRLILNSHPNFVAGWNHLGFLLTQWPGRVAEATTVFRHAVELQPSNFDAWNGLGAALSRLRQHSEAMQAFENAGMLSFSNEAKALCLRNRATSSLDVGSVGDALALLSQAAELEPNHPHLHVCLAQAKLVQKDPAAAARSCWQALELAPSCVDAYFFLGMALLVLGRPIEVTQVFSLGIERARDWQEPGVACMWLEKLLDEGQSPPESITTLQQLRATRDRLVAEWPRIGDPN